MPRPEACNGSDACAQEVSLNLLLVISSSVCGTVEREFLPRQMTSSGNARYMQFGAKFVF